MGKRGGAPVIYFYHDLRTPLYLMMVHAKAVREDITQDEKRQVKALAATLRSSPPEGARRWESMPAI